MIFYQSRKQCGSQWFIYNFGLMGPGTRCFQYQWVLTANLWVQNTIFNDKSAILLHPGTRWNKNLCAKDAGCAGNKITGILISWLRHSFLKWINSGQQNMARLSCGVIFTPLNVILKWELNLCPHIWTRGYEGMLYVSRDVTHMFAIWWLFWLSVYRFIIEAHQWQDLFLLSCRLYLILEGCFTRSELTQPQLIPIHVLCDSDCYATIFCGLNPPA